MTRIAVVLLLAIGPSCSLIADVPSPTHGDADAGGDGDGGADADAAGMVLTGGISTVSEAIATEGEIQMTDMGFEWGDRACGTGPSGEICVWGGIAP